MARFHGYSHLLPEKIKLFNEKYMCYIIIAMKHDFVLVNGYGGYKTI